MEFDILYGDENILVVDKPPRLVIFPEQPNLIAGGEKTLIDYLLEKFPDLKNVGRAPRYGIVHRLDKNTSGIILVAKNNTALSFLQKQFQTEKVIKNYLALVVGNLKNNWGKIETLIGRSKKDRRKQKVYLPHEPGTERKRRTETEYRVLRRFENYTLVEVTPKTGRKHQIRTHFAYINHPVAGDTLYGFKNQPCPENLNRQFLHASSLKIKLLGGEEREFESKLPEDLEKIIKNLK